MNKKTKNLLKVGVVALAILLCLSLAIGLTGAWYKASRTASGTLSLNQGIIIDYEGFGKETPGIWQKEETTTFKLFSDISAEPGKEITLNTSAIRANKDSTKFFARVKLDYTFYGADNNEITLENAESLIKSNGNIFGADWVPSQVNTEYFYYANSTNKELKVFEKSNQTFVNIFVDGAKLVIEGENFTGEGPGFETENGTITRIEILLTLETLQGDLTAAEENKWYILPPPVIEDFSVNELRNSSGTKIYTLAENQEVPLKENTAYQVVDNSGNGYQFTYALNEQEKTATITGRVGNPTELEIPDYIKVNGVLYKVTSIKGSAFYQYNGLTSATIGNSVTSIGSSAFFNCSNLTSVTIGNSVTSIEYEAFSCCNGLTTITVASGNPKYHSAGNCIIETATKTLIRGYNTSVIPTDGSVTSIGAGAFRYCSGLTTIIIPDSVTSIGRYAFNDCRNLQPSSTENSIKYLGNETNPYLVAWKAENTSITSCEINDKCKVICDYAFYQYSGLTSVTIGNSLTNIGQYAFAYCKALSSVNIASGVINIGKAAFEGCTSLTSITIPDKIDSVGNGSIGDSAFYRCSGLTEVIIGNGITNIGNASFYDCNNLTSVTIGNNVISIGDSSFGGCSKLSSIFIPDSVTNIGEYAFSGCSSLTSITIPDSVTSIGYYAFNGCSLQPSITDNGVKYLGNETNPYVVAWKAEDTWISSCEINNNCKVICYNAFSGCSNLTSITIPNNVTSIGDSAFSSCSGLTEIVIPNNVTSIRTGAFSACSRLESITVASGNTKYHSAGNCLIETATKTLIAGCKTSVIPTDGSVTSIGDSAFFGCSGLTEIVIPDSIISIGKWAFDECSRLTEITIPNSVTSIVNNAFDLCDNLTTTIGEGWVKASDNSAIDASTLLKDIRYDIKRAE